MISFGLPVEMSELAMLSVDLLEKKKKRPKMQVKSKYRTSFFFNFFFFCRGGACTSLNLYIPPLRSPYLREKGIFPEVAVSDLIYVSPDFLPFNLHITALEHSEFPPVRWLPIIHQVHLHCFSETKSLQKYNLQHFGSVM